MYRQARRVALPPPTVRLPRILPLSRLNGATPTRAAAWRRVSEPSSGLGLGQRRAQLARQLGVAPLLGGQLAPDPGGLGPRRLGRRPPPFDRLAQLARDCVGLSRD